MKHIIAAMMFCALSIGAADARCWKGETVSWYTDRHTASGEPYTYNESTCAHPTAPMGTRFKVTDAKTKKSVTCRVNDRGPNKWTRCKLDLNKHAAIKMAMLKKGVVKAKIERVITKVAAKPAAASPLVAEARKYLGKTASQLGLRKTLWCSAFMRHITKADGVDDRARSWLAKPRVKPAPGVIVVLTRGKSKHSGHVGVLAGFDRKGNPVIISGNHGKRVAIATYSKRRVLGYVQADG